MKNSKRHIRIFGFGQEFSLRCIPSVFIEGTRGLACSNRLRAGVNYSSNMPFRKDSVKEEAGHHVRCARGAGACPEAAARH